MVEHGYLKCAALILVLLPVEFLVLPAAVVDFATSGAAAHARSLDTANGAHRSPDSGRGADLLRALGHLQIL